MKLILIIAIAVFGTISANAQCIPVEGDNCITIRQSTVNAATKAARELIEARAVIVAFTAERTATLAERETAQRLLDRLNAVIALQDHLTREHEAVIALYKGVVQMQSELIERMSKQLSKPRSAFAKFMDTLKTVATLAAGILLGRGL